MGKTIKVTSGRSSATITQSDDLFQLFSKRFPAAMRGLVKEFEEIQKEAEDEWPVRQPWIKKDQSGRHTGFRRRSKGSWKNWKIITKLDRQRGKLVVSLWNLSPYAYAIRYGADSVNHRGEHITKPLRRRVVTEVLVKPMRKKIKKLGLKFRDDLAKG